MVSSLLKHGYLKELISFSQSPWPDLQSCQSWLAFDGLKSGTTMRSSKIENYGSEFDREWASEGEGVTSERS